MFSVSYSDHRCVYTVIQCSEVARGPGFWKFNNELLHDLQYVQFMNSAIEEFMREQEQTDVQLKWELLKRQIRDESIEYSKSKAMKRKNDKLSLYTDINDCDLKLSHEPLNELLQKRRHKIRLQLEIHEQIRTKSAMIRSRIK